MLKVGFVKTGHLPLLP